MHLIEVSMVRKYHNHKLQTNPPHREEEPQDIHNNKTPKRQQKQSNQLSLLHQDNCKTRKGKVIHTKTKTNTEPPQTVGGTYNNKSMTTEPRP